MAELSTNSASRWSATISCVGLLLFGCSPSTDSGSHVDASVASSAAAATGSSAEPTSSAEPSPSLDAGMDAASDGVVSASHTSHDSTGAVTTDAGQTTGQPWSDAGALDASVSDAGNDDDALFIPRDIPNQETSGADYGLTLTASTLRREASGLRFYAAVRNVAETPVCRATMLLNFYDSNEQQIAVASGDLLTSHLYHSADDTLIIPCVAPGALAVAVLDVNYDIRVEDIARMEHLFPAFGFEVVPYPPFTVNNVQFAAQGGQGTYVGTFSNSLETSVEQPTVTMVQLTAVGRPTHVVSTTENVQVAPGGVWPFEVEVPGPSPGFVTFAMANIPLE